MDMSKFGERSIVNEKKNFNIFDTHIFDYIIFICILVQLNDYMEKEVCSVFEAQAKRIKELYMRNQLSEYEIHKILCDESEREKVYLDTKKLRSYFPKNYSMQQCKEELWKILDNWYNQQNE